MNRIKEYKFKESNASTKVSYKGYGRNVQKAFIDMQMRRGQDIVKWNKGKKYWEYEIGNF